MIDYSIGDNEKRSIPDGVWDITGLVYISVTPPPKKKYNKNLRIYVDDPKLLEIFEKWEKDIIKFKEDYPNYAIANAYQTETPFLIEKMPTTQVKYRGSGFNHGANNIIDDCPKTILILGEDD